jgi:hypothetical protein
VFILFISAFGAGDVVMLQLLFGRSARTPLPDKDDTLVVFCGPANSIPTFANFNQSVLGKTASRYFRAIDADDIETDPGKRRIFLRYGRSPTASERLKIGHLILNDTAYDDDKRYVARQMQRVFGYSHGIDPLRYAGEGVVKSRANAKHDGRIIRFPITAEELREEAAYERLIDSTGDDGTICDIRLNVLAGSSPLAYLKYRPIATRFSNDNSYCELVRPLDVLSREELASCLRFALSIGMDFGEMDVLRDKTSKRIYIVDVTITPFGPPNHLPDLESERAMEILARSFAPIFL